MVNPCGMDWYMITIELPWPPSVNHYWRHTKNGHYISLEGSIYRETVFWSTASFRNRFSAQERLSVYIDAFPPDKRKRDLDNILKSLLDALQKSGVYQDDSQIDNLTIVRKLPLKGCVCVSLEVFKKQSCHQIHNS